MLDGAELWVLIHVEVQGNRDPDFAKRMYACQYRAYDLHEKPVVSLAILADEECGWRPEVFGYRMWGTELHYRFNTVKLLDYPADELERSDNPFAIVTLAHLTGKETRNHPEERLQQKKRIARMLYERGFDRQRVMNLFRFIDWVLHLPAVLEERFWKTLCHYEEDRKMRYVTSVERIGMRKGERIGRLEGKTEMLLKQLQVRFGSRSGAGEGERCGDRGDRRLVGQDFSGRLVAGGFSVRVRRDCRREGERTSAAPRAGWVNGRPAGDC
ncbi:MAG: hypothetical protein HQM03_03655 [Magnetococcales bacterium]|nr:hypothetical protein [Magnetococcales bacterium]